jgi:hypothetical protein
MYFNPDFSYLFAGLDSSETEKTTLSFRGRRSNRAARIHKVYNERRARRAAANLSGFFYAGACFYAPSWNKIKR